MINSSVVKFAFTLQGTKIVDIIKKIDKGNLGLVFTLDKEQRVTGVITDGDVRRAILSGKSSETLGREIMKKDPLVLTEQQLKGKLTTQGFKKIFQGNLMDKDSILIPIIGNDKKVKRIAVVVRRGSEFRVLDLKNTKIKNLKPRAVQKILIVGGAGYIGSVLSRELLERGYKVRVFDNLTYGNQGIKDLDKNKNFEFVKGDLLNITEVVDAIKDIDAVVHLGAIVGDPASSINPQKTIEINYLATKSLAEICRYNQINRFIFASTCSVYGALADPEKRLNEKSLLNPLSLYAETKLRSEQGILEINDGNFSPTVFRLATVYGLSPRMRFDLVVNTFIAKSIFEKSIIVFGGNQWRPNIHVRDVADGFINCLEASVEKVKNQTFNLGSNKQNYRISEVADIIQKNLPDTQKEVKSDEKDSRNYNVSFDKISKMLGFRARRDIKDGIEEIQKEIKKGSIKDYKETKYSDYDSLLSTLAK